MENSGRLRVYQNTKGPARQLLQDTWVMRGIVRVISYLRSFGMWCLGYKSGVFGAWGWVGCADLFGRAAKGFTPLCSNYPQLAPGHTLWWVLGVERRPTPLPNYTASSCGLYRVSEGRDDRTSPREVSVRFV